ncbi:MAG: RNA 2',3'-cyclic phosphodiesterase [Methylophaga sp.]|nr:RNA 2',3'-cyclic phosphodiesterase [Methylophaga sp.]
MSRRLFFAIQPPADIRQAMDDLFSVRQQGLKYLSADNLHVTLVFLGQVEADTEARLVELAGHIEISPFSLSFTEAEFWPKPRIICLTATEVAKPLQQLVLALSSIAKDCGVTIEERPYRPHVTLVRKANQLLPLEPFEFQWQAQSFALYLSESTDDGPGYTVIRQWRLSPG